MLKNVIENGRRSGAPKRFDPAWVKVLQDHLGAYKHAEFGLGTVDHAGAALRLHADDQQRDPDELVLQAALRPGPDAVSGRDRRWTSKVSTSTPASSTGSRTRSGRARARRSRRSWARPTILEQYFAVNVIFEPLVGELFRSGFVMQMAAAQNDFITPAVVSAAEGDYERNLANAVELFHMLTHDQQHGAAQPQLFMTWLEKHGALAHRRGARAAADLVAAAGQGGAVHRRAGAGAATACARSAPRSASTSAPVIDA